MSPAASLSPGNWLEKPGSSVRRLVGAAAPMVQAVGAFGHGGEPLDAFQVDEQARFGAARANLGNEIGSASENSRFGR